MHASHRLHQATREARWALIVTIAYLIGWVCCAYLPSDTKGPLNFPLWFELACLYLPVVFIVVAYWLIKIVYQDISLEKDMHDD